MLYSWQAYQIKQGTCIIRGFVNIISKIILIVFAWLWLFGGNYITTLIRFPRFMRKSIELN